MSSRRVSHWLIDCVFWLVVIAARGNAAFPAEPIQDWKRKGADSKEWHQRDWLIEPARFRARVSQSSSNEVVLNNGLISRTWRLAPNAAMVAFDNLMTEEAIRLR